MRDELERYLDGEEPREALPPDLREEAEAWDRMTAALRGDVPGPAPAWLEGAVMEAVRREAEPVARPEGAPTADGVAGEAVREGSLRERRGGLLAWWLRPRQVPVSPLTGLLAAAAVAALVLWSAGDGPAPAPGGAAGSAAAGAAGAGAPGAVETVVYVQFVLDAPGARSVGVAGDFTDWGEPRPLEDPDGDGVWTGRVAVRPGVHQYMFVVDGDRWVTDPRAERYTDDGFGNRNAVLAVARPRT